MNMMISLSFYLFDFVVAHIDDSQFFEGVESAENVPRHLGDIVSREDQNLGLRWEVLEDLGVVEALVGAVDDVLDAEVVLPGAAGALALEDGATVVLASPQHREGEPPAHHQQQEYGAHPETRQILR